MNTMTKVISMLNFFIIIPFLLSAVPAEGTPVVLKQSGIYYVLAPNGLNMRRGADAASSKIMTLAYGTKVELIQPAAQRNMRIDNFPGGMAKVKVGSQEGYVFDGYLSRMPAPSQDQDQEDIVAAYVEKARAAGLFVIYEKCHYDADGYYRSEDTITPDPIADWAGAYLLAQRLFDIPTTLPFPKPSQQKEEVIHNSKKLEYAWEDSLRVFRNEKGVIIRMVREVRMEGGGSVVTISRNTDLEKFELSQTLMAD